MGLFEKIFKGEANELPSLDVDDEEIVAIADGTVIDIATVPDEVFANEVMGKSIAFKYSGDKVTLCSPANGKLAVLYPTGHAFGVIMNNGIQLLIHIGVNTVESQGKGFTKLNKKQGDVVKAGDPIVEVDLKTLSENYDMSTMVIISDDNGKEISFIESQDVVRGQIIARY